MIYLQLFLSYLKIGFFGFGGGYSMLSLIHHEVVINHQWISSATLSDIIAISQMTPGPIAINSATYIGYEIAGFWGSVVATTAVCLPSLTIMVIITRFFLRLRESKYMERVMSTMRPAVLGMIAAASVQLIFPEESEGASMIDAWSWAIFAVAFYASMRRVNPIKLIVAAAVAGIAIYYIPTLFTPNDQQPIGANERMEQQWEQFEMSSAESIESPQFEQQWVDFLHSISSHNPRWAASQLQATFELCEGDPQAIESLLSLSEKYLYNPSSLMRNDELLIPILEWAVQCEAIPSDEKIRSEAILRSASLNRVGTQAANFATPSGEMLHSLEADFTLLYFFEPDCPQCNPTNEIIESSELLHRAQNEGRMQIISTSVAPMGAIDTLYNITATPTLYLLDEQKRVILKDRPIEEILQYLQTDIKL